MPHGRHGDPEVYDTILILAPMRIVTSGGRLQGAGPIFHDAQGMGRPPEYKEMVMGRGAPKRQLSEPPRRISVVLIFARVVRPHGSIPSLGDCRIY